MNIKRILFFFFLAVLIVTGCTRESIKEKKEKEEEKTDTLKYAYIIVSDKGYCIADENLVMEKDVRLNDSIFSIRLNDDEISLVGKNIYEISMKTGNIINNGQNEMDSFFAAMKNGYAEIVGKNVVFREKNKQFILFSSSNPLKEIWRNPSHDYLYVSDSLGYIYALDFEKRILRKRLYTGQIKDFTFGNIGSRIFIVSKKSLLVLDYETLNIIYEVKGEFSAVYPFNRSDVFYLLNGDSTSLQTISSRKYKNLKSFKIGKEFKSILSDKDSLLLLFNESKGEGSVFFNGRKVLNFENDSLLGLVPVVFHESALFLSSNSTIARYDIKNRSFKKTTIKNCSPYFVYPFLKKRSSIKTQYVAEIKKKDTIENKIIVASGPFYSIQLMSFKDKTSSESYIEKMKREYSGAKVFSLDTVIKGENYTRVYIGRYATKDEAKGLAETLKLRSGYKDLIIRKFE